MREACAPFGPLSDAQWREVTKHSTMRKGGVYVMAFDPAIITHMRGGGVAGVEFGSEFLYGVDLWPTYDAIRCPTLVLRGAESTLLQKSTAAEMTRRGPQGRGGGVRGHRPRALAHGGGPDQGGARFFAR